MAIKHEAITSRSNIYNVDPRAIQVRDGWNPRTEFDGIDELANSIFHNGLKVPLQVRKVDDDIFLIDGERRLKAIRILIEKGVEIVSVPCIFADRNISDVEAMFLAISANEGKPLDPIEEAEAFNRLKNWGVTVSNIARRKGKSEVFVYRRLLLVNASPELQAEIKAKNINLTEAEEIIKTSQGIIDDQNKKTRARKKSNRLSPKEIRDLVKDKELALEVAPPGSKEYHYTYGFMDALKAVLDRTTMESE